MMPFLLPDEPDRIWWHERTREGYALPQAAFLLGDVFEPEERAILDARGCDNDPVLLRSV